MQPDLAIVPPPPQPPSTVNFIFFNERGLRAGWRLLLYSVILYLLLFVASGIFNLILSSVSGKQANDVLSTSPLWMGLQRFAVFAAVAVATLIMSRVERRSGGVYGLPLQSRALSCFAIGYVFWGFLPLTLILAILRALGVFHFGSPIFSLRTTLPWALAWGFAFLMVALFEDYSFRGYPLFTLSDGIGFWPAAIILALAFGWIHTGNPGENHIGIVGVVLFALFASATIRRTGNLWLALGAHAGWDWGESFFYGVSDSGLQAQGHLFNPPPPQGPAWLSGGTVGPEGSIVVLIVWALMTVGFLLFWPRAETSHVAAAQEHPQTLI